MSGPDPFRKHYKNSIPSPENESTRIRDENYKYYASVFGPSFFLILCKVFKWTDCNWVLWNIVNCATWNTIWTNQPWIECKIFAFIKLLVLTRIEIDFKEAIRKFWRLRINSMPVYCLKILTAQKFHYWNSQVAELREDSPNSIRSFLCLGYISICTRICQWDRKSVV